MLTAMLTDTTVAYNLPDLIKRLRHYFGVTTTLADRWVQLNPNQAARVAGANAQRLFMNIQVASGMTVYEGQASSVGATVLPVGPNPGYQYPQSGGWSYGPEFTGELWLVSATSGIVTIKEGSSDVAYP